MSPVDAISTSTVTFWWSRLKQPSVSGAGRHGSRRGRPCGSFRARAGKSLQLLLASAEGGAPVPRGCEDGARFGETAAASVAFDEALPAATRACAGAHFRRLADSDHVPPPRRSADGRSPRADAGRWSPRGASVLSATSIPPIRTLALLDGTASAYRAPHDLAPLLVRTDIVRELPVRLPVPVEAGVLDRHAELVDAYLAEAERGRTHHRGFRDARPGRCISRLRRSSRRPAQRPACPRALVEFRTALDDADVVETRQHDRPPSRRRDHRHHAFVIADRRRGDEEPARLHRRLAARRRRRSADLHPGGDPEPPPGGCTARSERLLGSRRRARLTRVTTEARSAAVYPANRSRRSATSAPITRRSRTVTRRASREPTRRRPAGPRRSAAIVAANSRSPSRSVSTVQLGLRADARQFGLLVVLTGCRRDGRSRTQRAPDRWRTRLRSRLAGGDPLLRRRVRTREGTPRTWSRANSPTVSAVSDCWYRAGWSLSRSRS